MIQSNKTIRDEKDTNLLSFIRFRFFPFWPLFGFLILIALSAAFVYLKWAPPSYEASADLLIKDEKKGSDDGKMLESLNIFTTKKIVEDEIEVLQSQTIMKDVVRNLNLYVPISEKSDFKSVSAYNTSPVGLEIMGFDSLYKERQKVLLDQVAFRYDSASHDVFIGKTPYHPGQWFTYPGLPQVMMRFQPNPRFVKESAHPLFFSVINPKVVTNALIKGLNVSAANKLSSVVSLSLRDENPQRAEDILNELINVYNHASINDKNQLAINTLAFVEKRLRHVKLDLDSAELKIQRFKTQNGGASLSDQSTTFLKTVNDNDQKASELSMQLAVLDEAEKYVRSSNSAGGIVPATLGLNDEGLTQLLQKLYDSKINYEKLRRTVGENNPMVLSLSAEIEKITPNILANIQIQKKSIQAGLAALNTTSNSFASRLQGVPEKERALLESSRQETILNSVYAFLLQKREEASLSYASTVSDSRTVNVAESSLDPVGPKRSIVLGVALAVAMGIGIIIVYGKEFFSNKILFRREIEGFTAAPIIAEISRAGKKTSLVAEPGTATFLEEQFRQLRAALGLHTKNNRKKKLLITSSIAGEGKSFISTRLAQSLAATGKKVILLDLDLRNPRVSAAFRVSGDTGISDYLEGGREPYEIIKRSSYENLFIAGAGTDAPNTPELTFNTKLSELFDYLEGVFDFIVIDSAPVNPVSDAYVLTEYCDSTLYVIRHDYTPKAFIQLLDENIKIKPLKDLVIVFNSIKSRGLFKGQYGLDFGYGNEFAVTNKRVKPGSEEKVVRTNS